MVISFALLSEDGLATSQQWRRVKSLAASSTYSFRSRVRFIGAASIYLALVLSAFLSLIPAKEISRSSTAGLLTMAADGGSQVGTENLYLYTVSTPH